MPKSTLTSKGSVLHSKSQALKGMNDALQLHAPAARNQSGTLDRQFASLKAWGSDGEVGGGLSRFAPTAWWKLTNQDNELKSQGGLMNSMLLREDEVVSRLHLPG